MIVLDIETTALFPEKNSTVSIGSADFKNPGNIFYEVQNFGGFRDRSRCIENKWIFSGADSRFFQTNVG